MIQSPHYLNNLITWFENMTLKSGLKWSCYWTINLVQGSGEAQETQKITVLSHYSIYFQRKQYYARFILFNQLSKLIGAYDISFFSLDVGQ